MSLPSLLKKFESITRDIMKLEADRADVQAQILASSRPTRRARRQRDVDPRGVPETLLALCRALKDGPAGPGELGEKLGISRGAATKRLESAVKKKFVEKLGYARYALTDAARSVAG